MQKQNLPSGNEEIRGRGGGEVPDTVMAGNYIGEGEPGV